MDEKGQKPLTIGDILDQLIKPSVLQGPEVLSQKPVSPTPPKTTIFPSRGPSVTGLNLPRLGKEPEKTGISELQSGIAQVPELKLYIRTMSADLERLKKGQQPSGLEVKSALTPPLPKTTPPKPVQPRPTLPRPVAPLPPRPVQPPPHIQSTDLSISSPPAPQLPVIPSAPSIQSTLPGKEPGHSHPERIISEKDLLPPFLGAPIPKKVIKQKEEKVEYRLIAKIIGSGMTVGITITVVMAIAAYLLVNFLFLNREETATPTPVTSPTATIPFPEINELETIFKGTAMVDFRIPEARPAVIPALKSFLDGQIQILTKKEFKRINFTNSTDNAPINQNFAGLLDIFSIRYPLELRQVIAENHITLLYGQEELFGESSESIPVKLVFIVEVKDTAKTTEIMMNWESIIANDLKEIFNIDPSKEASRTFLDNERRDAKIRYKNFPLPDNSLDYAILSSLTGKHYLILTNSRESMYSPTDKLQGL
ncbi:MAG: hypothetical protein Q8R55_06830 [Candidatus Taylorbacteria bacterium]|nr:hypothetical protein [Candidatus Taylorbacteria bacterium]